MYDGADNKTHLLLVNGVVFKDNTVLISQRSWEKPHEPGKWTIPGGKVERTSAEIFNILEKTVQAEVKEETGIEIEDEMSLVINNTFLRSTGQHVVVLVFKCQYKSGQAIPLEDTINYKWVTLEEVKQMQFAPNVQKYIIKAFKES